MHDAYTLTLFNTLLTDVTVKVRLTILMQKNNGSVNSPSTYVEENAADLHKSSPHLQYLTFQPLTLDVHVPHFSQ